MTSSFRILPSTSLNKGWDIKPTDLHSVFLFNGTPKEDGFFKRLNEGKEEVYKLKRSLHGLKISPKCCNDTFTNAV